MYTQCPHCEAIFRVSMKEITTAHGQLRCGECGHIFNAMNSLSSTLPGDSGGLEQNPKAHGGVGNGSDSNLAQGITKSTYNNAKMSTESSGSSVHNTPTKPSLGNAKSTTPTQDRARKYMLWAGMGLVTILFLQTLYVSRNWLAHQPATAGITRSVCKTLGCSITPKRDPTKIEIISHNVYAHPNEPGSLIITATMRNTASYGQPLPLIEVSFLDKNNHTIALRRFRPEEYTPKNRADKKLFTPNETLYFRMKIKDPGKEAVTFQFNFL